MLRRSKLFFNKLPVSWCTSGLKGSQLLYISGLSRCSQKYIISFFRFQDSGDSIGKLVPENKDKEILVPLTGSMYVPGKLSDPEKVIVDVGTGYVVILISRKKL